MSLTNHIFNPRFAKGYGKFYPVRGSVEKSLVVNAYYLEGGLFSFSDKHFMMVLRKMGLLNFLIYEKHCVDKSYVGFVNISAQDLKEIEKVSIGKGKEEKRQIQDIIGKIRKEMKEQNRQYLTLFCY